MEHELSHTEPPTTASQQDEGDREHKLATYTRNGASRRLSASATPPLQLWHGMQRRSKRVIRQPQNLLSELEKQAEKKRAKRSKSPRGMQKLKSRSMASSSSRSTRISNQKTAISSTVGISPSEEMDEVNSQQNTPVSRSRVRQPGRMNLQVKLSLTESDPEKSKEPNTEQDEPCDNNQDANPIDSPSAVVSEQDTKYDADYEQESNDTSSTASKAIPPRRGRKAKQSARGRRQPPSTTTSARIDEVFESPGNATNRSESAQRSPHRLTRHIAETGPGDFNHGIPLADGYNRPVSPTPQFDPDAELTASEEEMLRYQKQTQRARREEEEKQMTWLREEIQRVRAESDEIGGPFGLTSGSVGGVGDGVFEQ